MWNARYGKSEYAHGKQPNVFFAEELSKLQPSSILLPAEGEGRNAVHALRHGWQVVAFDLSEKGREKAIALAKENNVQLSYEVCDALKFKSKNKVQAIGYCHFHPLEEQCQKIYDHLNSQLSLGGAVIFEGFSKNNIGMGSGGPQIESMCFTVDKVKMLFQGYSQIQVWEEKVVLSEGPLHEGEAMVIRARGVK